MKWKNYQGRQVATEATLPGVWKVKDGGFLIRGRKKNPRTNKNVEVKCVVETKTAKQALSRLQEMLEEKVSARGKKISIPSFKDYAEELLTRKVKLGEIQSAAGKKKWESALKQHFNPAFGDILLDQLHRSDIQEWVILLAGQKKPRTINSLLSILRVIIRTAVVDYDLDKDPIQGIKNLDTSNQRTYTEEKPNSVPPEKLPDLLNYLRDRWPQHYAQCLLGFLTGLRPSSMRPLRRCGESSDILWDEGTLLIRRSLTLGEEPMERTKNGRDQRIHLPPEMMDILTWHVETQLNRRQAKSDLLFPGEYGFFQSRGALRVCLEDAAQAIGLDYPLTPKCLRRTYQDVARRAGLSGVVLRSISGHSSEQMTATYSTVRGEDQLQALGTVLSALRGQPESSGKKVGVKKTTHRKNRKIGDGYQTLGKPQQRKARLSVDRKSDS